MHSFGLLFSLPIPLAALLLAHPAVGATHAGPQAPTSVFQSRPDLHAPKITLELLRPELVSDGYVFLAPYHNIDSGPYIYDNFGQLVWSGAGQSGASTTHNIHVCQYKGADHLCMFQGTQHHGWARGHGVIMDNSYRIVKTVEAAGSAGPTDMHEFRLINNGQSALVTIYQAKPHDLGPYGVGPGLGWIQECIFQEIDVETGSLIFEWRALDHIAPSFSYTCIDCTDTSGNGLSRDTPWDWFHLNSIDKNADGDYLISARHTAAVYKIGRGDGHVIWELNGANPTFRNANLHFSSQHHARWVQENATYTVLSLFDNASNTQNITNHESRGMLIGIDHVALTATKLREWKAPEKHGNGVLAGSQGNMQILADTNIFIGWGDHAFYSEHLDNGEAVMYGKVADWQSGTMMYRCNKFPWVGHPLTVPSLYTYSLTGTNASKLVFHVSWNGATEVRSWNFYSSANVSGPYVQVGSRQKLGFETEFHSQHVGAWSFAEAVDKQGKVLSRSAYMQTFVPSDYIILGCDNIGCGAVPPLLEGEEFEKSMPEVPLRGQNYSRGYDTKDYYPSTRSFLDKLPGSNLSIPMALLVLTLLSFVLVFARRQVLTALLTCDEFVRVRILGREPDSSELLPFLTSPRYRKVEGLENID